MMNDKDRLILEQNTEISRLRRIIAALLEVGRGTSELNRNFVKEAYEVIENGKDGK